MRTESGQVRVFHCPRRGSLGNKEVFLDKASKLGETTRIITPLTRPTITSSILGKRPEIVGYTHNQTYDVKEGEVIKIFVSTINSYGKRHKLGSVYIQMRENAAHRVLEFDVTDHASASFQRGVLEGCFDVLSVDDLDDLGVSILNHYRKFATDAVRNKLISKETILRDELSQATKFVKKTVLNPITNEEKTIKVSKRPRRRLGI